MKKVERKYRRIVYLVIAVLYLSSAVFAGGSHALAKEGNEEENSTNIKLYARSAVLMDADSGRVLFGKNEDEAMPMASTTKIMTCIIALENGNPEDIVTVSGYAAAQPKVHLGMRAEQHFRLEDLLYSLMLESHNDSAVAIAEHIGGSVEGFAKLMNKKARDIGCETTFFITPNGLDATSTNEAGEVKVHSTSAADLARIMKYCIGESKKTEEFLRITRTQSHSFSDVEGKRSYSCANHNAFLSMMDGALSGKTGFTNNAGYCYVGALKKDGKTFIVALLACGWPNNKSYKWSDTKKLMSYGLENYEYRNVYEPVAFDPLWVEDGVPENGKPYGKAYTEVEIKGDDSKELNLLLRADEEVEVKQTLPKELEAPVTEGIKVGAVSYYLGEELIREYPIVVKSEVMDMDFPWILRYVLTLYAI